MHLELTIAQDYASLINESVRLVGGSTSDLIIGTEELEIIIIKMYNSNRDGSTAKESLRESTDAANNTEEPQRTPAKERAQPLQPRVEQDSCVASSLFYTIEQLNWSGSDDEVA